MQKKNKKNDLPKISLITPCLNQEKFIERTILSVLNQDYPNLEYIFVDGGSTDGTLEILKKYADKIIITSQKDSGQTEAINKGIRKSTGDVLAYLNADDLLCPGALDKVGSTFKKENCLWLTGHCIVINETGKEVRTFISKYKNFFLRFFRTFSFLVILNYISQPSTFYRRQIIKKAGEYSENWDYSMDYDYWLRIAKIFKLTYIDSDLSLFRTHNHSKSRMFLKAQQKESYQIAKIHSDSELLLFLHKVHDFIVFTIYKFINK